MNGKVLISMPVSCDAGKCKQTLNISELENGVYFVKLTSENHKTEVKKLLKH
jgi:hypothetical protein